MSNYLIDINADVGEGLNNESELVPYISSCNIACGGHAGDMDTMKSVARLAKKHQVKIGAHPSFPDKNNFGRLNMKISDVDLCESLKQQIETLQDVLYSEGLKLHHIKPHGALYNLAAKNENTAEVIIKVIKRLEMPLKLYAPHNSVIERLAKKENIEVVFEAFADRNYNEDLSLVSRQNNNAILNNKVIILNHVLKMIHEQKIKTINGVEVPMLASTFCVHGDTENAIEILKFLTSELPKKRITTR